MNPAGEMLNQIPFDPRKDVMVKEVIIIDTTRRRTLTNTLYLGPDPDTPGKAIMQVSMGDWTPTTKKRRSSEG